MVLEMKLLRVSVIPKGFEFRKVLSEGKVSLCIHLEVKFVTAHVIRGIEVLRELYFFFKSAITGKSFEINQIN